MERNRMVEQMLHEIGTEVAKDYPVEFLGVQRATITFPATCMYQCNITGTSFLLNRPSEMPAKLIELKKRFNIA